MIPVFVLCSTYYGKSVAEGAPDERWRWAAITVFLVASLSDALDGYIARRFNQKSHLGNLLDPLADKALLISALVTLSVTGWPVGFPLWFPVLVITRDLITTAGALMIHHLDGEVTFRIHWTGKVATFLLMVSVAWVMLRIPSPPLIVPILAAGIFVAVSGALYIIDGIRQIHASGHGKPEG